MNARKVETAQPGRHGDGRGLFLYVKATGARSWVLRYQVQGRRRDLGLGPYADVSFAMARERAAAARSGETRGATWAEVDLGARLWTLPASRMKAGKDQSNPARFSRLATNPVVCRSAIPKRTLSVRLACMAELL